MLDIMKIIKVDSEEYTIESDKNKISMAKSHKRKQKI